MPTYNSTICRQCPYHPGGPLALPPTTRAHQPLAIEQRGSDVLIVARAPGVDEWEDGHPLISPNPQSAAHRLRKSWLRIGKNRQDYDITNAVLCYPGKPPSSPDGKPPRDNPPDAVALVQCRHWLQGTINSGRYRKIVTLGDEARAAVVACGLPSGVNVVSVPHPSSGRLFNSALVECPRSFWT
ncbi:uracil-DNA glycosylase family protein [Archangium gephyra]|uniref:uracil-DNA glycosylase family protein n=1 Tax=Archangium gephyra TaxID=48 RepID=UPI003B818A21